MYDNTVNLPSLRHPAESEQSQDSAWASAHEFVPSRGTRTGIDVYHLKLKIVGESWSVFWVEG